jgi:glycerate kinase
MVVEVAVDVTNPLTGPEGASAVYGPQKGATPEMVKELDAALAHFGEVVKRDLGKDVAGLPGAGAAGGAGAGLVAFLDARLVRGASLVVEAAGFDRALAGASVVMSGEGRVDAQTAYGKGPAEVASRSARAGVPVVLLAAALGDGWESMLEMGVGAVLPLAERPSTLEEMERDVEALVERAAERACRLLGLLR